MSLSLVSAPSVEPVTLEDVKEQLRLGDDASHDRQLDRLISAARRWVEGYTGRALITQTWDWQADFLETCQDLPLPPLQSVTSVSYVDTAGSTQVLSSSLYTVDTASDPGRIYPVWGESWPSFRYDYNAWTVRLVAGYGTASSDVPEDLRQAVLMHVEANFDGCEAGASMQAVKALCWPYRVADLPS